MNKKELALPQVGTKVLYVSDFGQKPVEDTVGRVTKTAIVLQSHMNRTTNLQTKWSPCTWRSSPDGSFTETPRPSYKRTSPCVYLYSEKVLAELMDRYNKAEKEREEKKEREAVKKKERDDKDQQEMNQVREDMGGDSGLVCNTRSKEILPDGSRIYLVAVPVKQCFVDRKLDWERVLIRCKDVEVHDWQSKTTTKKVECAFTSCNGSSSSFYSMSTYNYDDDNKAIWAAVKTVYHSW